MSWTERRHPTVARQRGARSRCRWACVLFALALAAGLSGCSSDRAPGIVSAVPMSVELVEEPDRYDGRTITFEGEVVGEAMVRGDHAWIHVNDDGYARSQSDGSPELEGYNTGMPVWIDAELVAPVTSYGDHAREGDLVEVVGEYNAACSQHGGDTDIHATGLRIVRQGRPLPEEVEPVRVWWAAALVAAVAAAYGVHRWRLRSWERRGA